MVLFDKRAKFVLKSSLILGVLVSIFFLAFAFGAHVVTVPGGGTSYNLDEDVGFVYNISINNTDEGIAANITQVNITLPSEFLFVPGPENGTDSLATFVNTSNVLSWSNFTFLINASNSTNSFWFNATAATPGNYNISVMTLNETGTYYTNVSVIVNDTTVPSLVNFTGQTPVNNSILSVGIPINISSLDNGVIDSTSIFLFNSTNALVNTTIISGSSAYVNFTGMASGTYYVNASVNDSYGNTNNSETRTFRFASSTFLFNGTVYDTSSNRINNSVINITIRDMSDFSIVGYSFGTSNASGWFNMAVPSRSDWMYEPKITRTNATWGHVELIGQSLPAFPSNMFVQIAGTEFYLRDAGTINITAINSTGDRISFTYQVKDTKLGYPIADGMGDGAVSEVVLNVPKNRNYSLMVYPDASMPVSFDWTNFSSTSSYNFGQEYPLTNLSSYNATTSTVHKQFNTTMSSVRAYGYILNTTGGAMFTGWDDFTVVPFLLEPGAMVHTVYGDLPYNLSAFFDANGNGDVYNLTSGYYNISLPATAETSEMILLASARNGSSYVGGMRNVSFSYSGSTPHVEFNFTLYELLGVNNNISMDTVGGGQVNISSAKQTFNILNSTNGSFTDAFVHAEVTVDYSASAIGAKEFTWMSDVSQGSSSILYVPLLNVSAGVKEMNVFVEGGDYAPKRTSYTQDELQGSEINISIGSFNPGDIDGGSVSGLKIALFNSNSTCDVPAPNATCVIGGTEGGQDFGDFNPMSAVMGGGSLSFRMGLLSSGIIVHYVNVDLLASGPPDALFDNEEYIGSTSGSFESVFRFGSQGPTIYDYVLTSIPYTSGSSSTTGLNETGDVNMSIRYFYDESWNVIWDTTTNGTNASALAGNYSHYAGRQSEWQALMNPTTCTTNSSELNVSSPCYIDTTNDRIWMRLPHFSGAGPQITGQVITADSSDDSSSSSSSGGGSTASFWTNTYVYNGEEFSASEPLTREYSSGHRTRIKVGGTIHHVGVISLTSSNVVVNVSSISQQATINIGASAKFDADSNGYYDVLVLVNGIANSKANLTISPISEAIPASNVADATDSEAGEENGGDNKTDAPVTGDENDDGEGSLWWVWVIMIVAILIAGGVFYYWRTLQGTTKKRK